MNAEFVTPLQPWANMVFWSAATVCMYLLARAAYRRLPRWWLSPLAVAPALLILLALGLHVQYRDYIRDTHWLVSMLGPVTVAFALPIYEQRALIRRYWHVLLIGVICGDVLAFGSSWLLAGLLGMSDSLRLSLLPRSISTPFAMAVSGDIGGVPNLTAVFVVMTGVFGAALGELLLAVLPLRSSMARGALLGMGAHGAGVARAQMIGRQEGAVASLVMILAGVSSVLCAPLVGMLLR